MSELNALRWDGRQGHYEVWFITLADRASGAGVWVRFAMHAPLSGAADCSLWFVSMQPDGHRTARRRSFPVSDLREQDGRLLIGDSELSARGSAGGFDDVRWELRWEPAPAPGLPVHPLLERARLARTMYVIPQPGIAIEGSVSIAGQELELSGARGAQAHLWGGKHASGWGWAHASDLEHVDGSPSEGDWVDAISVTSPRLGRDVGPSTAVVGSLLGQPFSATSPVSVLRASARSTLTRYRVDTRTRSRRLLLEVDAPRETLVGVTYEDPDGERLRCWNSEIATLRAWIWDRSRRGGWDLAGTLAGPARSCFEYAQRDLLPDMPIDLG